MKEIIDFIKSLLESSKERLKNPWLSSFIISWAVFNWKPISYFIYSDKSIEKILEGIPNYISDSYYWFFGFVGPLIVSLFYVLILPRIMIKFDFWLKSPVKTRKDNVIQQLKDDIIGKQKLATEEVELENIRAKYKDKADLNIQIEKLGSDLKSKHVLIEELQAEIMQLRNENLQIEDSGRTVNDSIAHLSKWDNEYLDFQKTEIFKYFKQVGLSIRNNNGFPNDISDIIKEKFIYKGIIKEFRNEEYQIASEMFTELGAHFWGLYVDALPITEKQSRFTVKEVPPPPVKDDDNLPF